MKTLEGMNLWEMKKLLWNIRTYADMTKKLGSRGAALFHKTLSWKQNFVIEYFPALWEEVAYEQAKDVFAKSFDASPEKSEITFIATEDIKGGMKVYCDDFMVDLSYKKVENLLQK